MTPQRYAQIAGIVEQALEQSSGDPGGQLPGLCQDDEALLNEARLFLAAVIEAEREHFLEGTISIDVRTTIDYVAVVDDFPDRRIGPYEIIRPLGKGGNGQVYLAVRREDYQQRVAIKVLAGETDSEDLLRRFRNEQQFLAALRHPNIARLFNAGVLDDGRPYFVLEYVDGQHVDVLCDAHRLSVEQRLRVFLAVCDAVSFAHRHAVIHRDLKPSNILVRTDGVPVLIDFGIAKLLNPELGFGGVELTRSRVGPLTPQYASPEQICGQRLATTTDVYSLGVVLYLLLTGCLPYDVRGKSDPEIDDDICLRTPPRPSNIVTAGQPATTSRRAAARASTVQSLHKRLAGDLDQIVLTCLAKRAEDRYQSVESLAEDIRRHLENLPLRIGKTSLGGRFIRWHRRHRAASITGATVALLILVSIGVILSQWLAIRYARDRHVASLVNLLAEVEPQGLPYVVNALDEFRDAGALRHLNTVRSSSEEANTPRASSRRALAQFALGNPARDANVLKDCFVTETLADPREVVAIQRLLGSRAASSRDATAIVAVLRDAEKDFADQRHYRDWLGSLALCSALEPESVLWTQKQIDLVVDRLLSQDLQLVDPWASAFTASSDRIVQRIKDAAADRDRPTSERLFAAHLLARFLYDRPAELVDAFVSLDPQQFDPIKPALARPEIHEDVLSKLKSVLATEPDPSLDDLEYDMQAQRQANAAIALLYLDSNPESIWPLFRDKSQAATCAFLCTGVGFLLNHPGLFIDRIGAKATTSDEVYALLTALGSFPRDRFKEDFDKTGFLREIASGRHGRSGAVQGACRWLSGVWEVPRVQAPKLQSFSGRNGRETFAENGDPVDWCELDWKENSAGDVMISFCRNREPDDAGRIQIHWIAATEVTRGQFARFLASDEQRRKAIVAREEKFTKRLGIRFDQSDLPQGFVNWDEAARYCNYLSRTEHLPEYYVEEGGQMKVADFDGPCSGYRLPAASVWRFACSAGNVPPDGMAWRFFGRSPSLLAAYGWYAANSDGTLKPVAVLRPNRFGLFDVYGNVLEWCDFDERIEKKRKGFAETRGGAVGDASRRIFTRSTDDNQRNNESPQMVQGFRVARTDWIDAAGLRPDQESVPETPQVTLHNSP